VTCPSARTPRPGLERRVAHARLLTVFVPGGLESYFEAVARFDPAADPASRAALDGAWGVEIVGPPLGDEEIGVVRRIGG
jgi:hypothetical protein